MHVTHVWKHQLMKKGEGVERPIPTKHPGWKFKGMLDSYFLFPKFHREFGPNSLKIFCCKFHEMARTPQKFICLGNTIP